MEDDLPVLSYERRETPRRRPRWYARGIYVVMAAGMSFLMSVLTGMVVGELLGGTDWVAWLVLVGTFVFCMICLLSRPTGWRVRRVRRGG